MRHVANLVLAGLCVVVLPVSAATFTVTSTNGSGPGSLRQAILDANAAVGVDTLSFNIASAGLTIQVTNALPAITEALTVDGASQPGYAGVPLIELSGQFGTNGLEGLRIEAGPVTLRSLLINRFKADGVKIVGGSGHLIEGCTIGLDAGGNDQGNTLSGISITNATDVTLGGPAAEQRNVISGNTQNGIYLASVSASNISIRGNFIGLNRTGNVGNGAHGVNVNQSAANTIGGDTPAARNVISHNGQTGVLLTGAGASNNVVAGNFIGTGSDGTGDQGNSNDGVQVNNAAGNWIGGLGAALANVIGGNNNDGLELTGAGASNNMVAGNRIGLDALGGALGNSAAGIRFNSNARSNTVGLAVTDGANWIQNNGGGGVEINSGTNNTDDNTSEFSPAIEPTFSLPGLTYTVTHTDDSGPESLRQALLEVDRFANATPDRIVFSIPGTGAKVISPLTPLPVPRWAVEIDGLTQPGATANTSTNEDNAVLLIQLDGAAMTGFGYGLELAAGGNTVRGLSLTRFASGALYLRGAGSNLVEACRIGVTPTGQPGANDSGVALWSPGNRVGGIAPAARNLIAGNQDYGVVIAGDSASNNVVIGNFIGLIGPTNALGHGRDGVVISQASHNRIGGTLEEGNLIRFSQENGVNVLSGDGNVILGNRFVGNGGKFIALNSGANGGIRPPVLSSVLRGSTEVAGTFQGEPFTTYLLQAMVYDASDPSVTATTLDTFSVPTDNLGRADYSHVYEFTVPDNWEVVVSATGPTEGTSVFSAPKSVFPANAVDLRVDLTGPYSAPPGRAFPITITPVNDGPTAADLVEATIVVPLGIRIATTSPDTNVVIVIDNETATASLGTLAPGESVPFTLTVTSPVEGLVPFTVTVEAAQRDARPANNLRSWETRITSASQSFFADVQIEFPDHPNGTIVGNSGFPTQFRVRVRNNGPQDATDIKADICHLFGFSPSTTELAAAAPTGTTYTVFAERDLVRWQIPALGAGQSQDLMVEALWRGDSRSDTNRNQVEAVAQSASNDPFQNNNVASAEARLPSGSSWFDLTDTNREVIEFTIHETVPPPTVVSSTSLVLNLREWKEVPPDRIVKVGNSRAIQIRVTDPGTPPVEFFALVSPDFSEPRVQIDQLNLSLGNGVFLANTDYGQATLTFLGSDTTRYLSLWHGPSPVILDAPVLSPNGAGLPHDMVFTFRIGDYGREVASGDFAFRLAETTGNTTSPPPSPWCRSSLPSSRSRRAKPTAGCPTSPRPTPRGPSCKRRLGTCPCSPTASRASTNASLPRWPTASNTSTPDTRSAWTPTRSAWASSSRSSAGRPTARPSAMMRPTRSGRSARRTTLRSRGCP